MDLISIGMLKKGLSNVTLAYTYKGSVSSTSALPDDADTGDLYTVGSDQYVYNGTDWVLVGDAISTAQIDALF